jgi:hypothetical protein
MLGTKPNDSGFNLSNLHEIAMNAVEGICAIFTRPVEMILRPWHGTRYFSVPVVFLSTALMVILPVISALFTGITQMIPFVHIPRPLGIFSMASFAEPYFLLAFLHGIRLYRRMIDMSLEVNSEYEGPPLPFVQLFPKSHSFWFTRIVSEPVFVFVTATTLGRVFIFQSGLTTYLQIAALMLAMKNFIGWHRAWEYLRKLMDARFAGPIIARMVDNRATEEDLATVHLASFPNNLAPDIREAAVSHIAKAFAGDPQNL